MRPSALLQKSITAASFRRALDSYRRLGGMGGAQPLAATMAGLSMLAVECDRDADRQASGSRAILTIRRRILDGHSSGSGTHAAKRRAISVGLLGNTPKYCRRS